MSELFFTEYQIYELLMQMHHSTHYVQRIHTRYSNTFQLFRKIVDNQIIEEGQESNSSVMYVLLIVVYISLNDGLKNEKYPLFL